jgi:hypothetical protein
MTEFKKRIGDIELYASKDEISNKCAVLCIKDDDRGYRLSFDELRDLRYAINRLLAKVAS